MFNSTNNPNHTDLNTKKNRPTAEKPETFKPTTVDIKNESRKDQKIIKWDTPFVRNILKNPLPKGGRDNFTSDPGKSTVDGGIIQYEQCRFSWSKFRELKTGALIFNASATPSTTCEFKKDFVNPSDGTYNLSFRIKKDRF